MHNGWYNFETWSIAVIIQNDEALYDRCHKMDQFRLEDFISHIHREMPERFSTIENWSEINWAELGRDL